MYCVDDLSFVCTDNDDSDCVANYRSFLEHEYAHCATTTLNVSGHVDLGGKSDSHIYVSSQSMNYNVWHNRLGHPSQMFFLMS